MQYALQYLKLEVSQVGSWPAYLLDTCFPCAHIVVAQHNIALVQNAVIPKLMNNQSSNLHVAAGVTKHLLRNGEDHAVASSTALQHLGAVRRSIPLQEVALLVATVLRAHLFFTEQCSAVGRSLSLGRGRLITASGVLRLLVAHRRLAVGQQTVQFSDERLQREVCEAMRQAANSMDFTASLEITMMGRLRAHLFVLSSRSLAGGVEVRLGQLLQQRSAERVACAHAAVIQSISKRFVPANWHAAECSALGTDE